MLCQACEKNDTSTSVICESCVTHYASIREGQFQERDLVAGEYRFVVRSWIHVPAAGGKKTAREDKATKKKGGLFGRKPAPEPAAEVEDAPPPDWKNRVFPLPDPVPATPAAVAAEPSPAPVEESYSAPAANEFGYDSAPGAVDETPELVIEMPEEAPVFELTPAPTPEPVVVEEAAAPEPVAPIIEETVPQIDVTPEPVQNGPTESEAPAAPALSSFFDSLATPEPVAVEPEPIVAPAPVEQIEPTKSEEPVAPTADLSGFFATLNQPAAEAPAPEPTPEPTAAAGPDLSSFFASLGSNPPAEAAPAAPEPVVVEEPAAPAAASELANFFASLNADDTAAASTPEPVVEAAPEPIASANTEAELDNFFNTLNQASTPAPEAVVEPEVAAPSTGPDLSNFFETLAVPVPQPSNDPAPTHAFEMPKATPVEPTPAAPEPKGFSIELDAPAVTPTSGVAPRASMDLKPPVHGAPFSIDLTPPAPAPQAPKPKTEAHELKKKLSSTGELSFADDDEDDEPSDGGLLSGLSFDMGKKTDAGFSIVRDDDDDDERTIEL